MSYTLRFLSAAGCIALLAAGGRTSGSGGPSGESDIQFIDIAAKAGIDAVTVAGGEKNKKYILESTGSGVAFIDYDNDGLLDVFLVNGSPLEDSDQRSKPTNHLYHNEGNNRFRDVTRQAGLAYSGWGQGVCVGDFNNDGWNDIFVSYYGDNLLFKNNGNGTFTEVGRSAGLRTTERRWGTGCAFLDYDRDGFLDLFVANYVDFDIATAPLPGSSATSCRWKGIPVFCGPRGLKGAQNLLYHNNGDGTFTDVSKKAGILHERGLYYGLGVVVADFDNDGWPDIYVACDSTPHILYHNNTDGTFTDIGVESGAAFNEDGKEQAGMGVGVADYNGDGFLDLVVTNFSDDTPTLYRNNRDGTFTDTSSTSLRRWNTRLLGWGTGFIDYDNDGWPDLFFANGHIYPEIDQYGLATHYHQPKALYRNLGDGTFEDVSLRSGPGITLERSARGAAFGDIDNDGDLDILVSNSGAPPTLLLNRGGNRNNWLALKLVGTRSNRSAIGARVGIVCQGRAQIDEVRSGGSWASQSDLRLHFGLGGAQSVDLVEVRWPSGITQRLEKIAANQTLRITEPLEPFKKNR
ncbi:MAG TPA: CRTAC1 family protein [Acidobacteriota bacterium]